jgi:hypothetical protein
MSTVIPGDARTGDDLPAGDDAMPVSAAAVEQPFRQSSFSKQRLLRVFAVVLPPVGLVLILLAFNHAAGLAEPDNLQFALLWAGFMCGMLPLIALACSAGINGVTRSCALVGIGLLAVVGRALRLPAGPVGYDEFAHMRQVLEAFTRGEVGHPSALLPISESFPGLHQVVSAFARLTGLPLWPPALAVIALAHVLSVLAVYQLVRGVGASATGAAVGAVIYTVNPSWIYFDTSFSYESLGLPLVLWSLAATVGAIRSRQRRGVRYIAVIVLCAATMPMVHHLSTIMLALILALLIAAGVVHMLVRVARHHDGPRHHLWPLLFAEICLVLSITFWWSKIHNVLLAYLSPALTRGWAQLNHIFTVAPSARSAIRAPFSNSQNPIYERVCGLLFPFVVLVLFLMCIVILWRNRHRFGSVVWGFAGVGAMFFLSLPMVLTPGGAEGAHRSWAYSFIGIAVLCGLAWSFRESGVAATHFAALRRSVARVGRPGVRVGVVAVVLTVLYIGGAALGINVSSRFPGSPHVGDDARSVSRESAAVASWMSAHAPVDTPVVADRYTSLQLAWTGRMAPLSPSPSFPVWDLYMSAQPVRRLVLKQVLDAEIRYFVVDSRMATTRPQMRQWFTGDEPGAGTMQLLPQAAIDRFNCLPWLQAKYGAGPLTVYEVNADVLRRTMAGSCGRQPA